MKNQRTISGSDRVIADFGAALHTLFAPSRAARAYPANADEAILSDAERRQSAGFMRVNHVGEVCAQALYRSQALTASRPELTESMQRAALEEVDHLAWCETRLAELDASRSLLNPLWYAGSFAIGAAAGVAGDKWNLGFVAETERQVVEHLESHLTALPEQDQRSRQVVAQMKQDESEHADMAIAAGAAPLPGPARWLMRRVARVMTSVAYRI